MNERDRATHVVVNSFNFFFMLYLFSVGFFCADYTAFSILSQELIEIKLSFLKNSVKKRAKRKSFPNRNNFRMIANTAIGR